MIPRRVTYTLRASFLLAVFWGVPRASAQQDPRFIEVAPLFSREAGVEPWDVEAATARMRSQFLLFGEGDRAWTSMRMVGDNRMFETNTGPGDDRNLWAGGNPIVQFSTRRGTSFMAFGIPLFMGAPRSEWVRYLVEGVESLRNARGEGFTVMWNASIFARPKDHNAADGLVGTLLSGARSTTDGTCLDHSAPLGGAVMPAGLQLLPGSNCPPTFSPAGGWLGDRPIKPDTWIALFKEQGSNFRFDRWRVPASRKEQASFLANNFNTYGHFNDYNSTTLRKFGNVVPGGAGDPARPGWPLGIDIVFNSFTFTLPSVANAKFWTGLIINNSQKLYGVPHDYDSLYIGLGPWPAVGGQDGDAYSIPELGAWVVAASNQPTDPECLKTKPIPLIGNTCGGFGGPITGFETGAMGLVVLKSPIGDLRNKLFTRPGSPFFRPDHPLAGDTITFNHAVNWNFGPWGTVWNQGSERQKFGVLSSTSDNTLDGRACSEFADLFTRWTLFMSNDWPENQCAYKAFVPGVTGGTKTWTYTTGRPRSKPLAPDTLHLANCGPPGCPVPWADTTWQGWSANTFGNLSQFHIGPFRLEAGDTTELFIAMYSARDSVPFESLTRAIVDFYLDLFAGPEAPPAVTIREVDIGTGVRPVGRTAADRPEVRLVWDDAPERWVDPFLTKFADDMQNAAAGTDLAIIRDANPGLVSRIRERARRNVARLLVFKSCDGGSTFDANNDCVGDRAVDERGNTVEPGWQAFRVLEPDASGDLPNTLTDGNVTAGVRYLYTILGQSKGFKETVINDPNARREVTRTGQTVFTCGAAPCRTTELVVAPALLNPLSRSAADPNVISVYVPASGAAGGRIASVEFVDRDTQGKSTVPFDVLLVSADLRESNFRVSFGNRIRIVEERNAATDSLLSVEVTVEDVARTVVGDTGRTTATRVFSSQTFRRTDGVAVTLNAATQTSDVVQAGVRRTTLTIGPGDLDPDRRFAAGFVLTEGELPLLASGKLEGDAATPGAFLAHPVFPGFLVSADNRSARAFQEKFWLDARGDTLSAELDPTLDLDRSLSRNTEVQGLTFGEYVITFADSVFGPGSPFRLNFFDPAETDARFDASLRARRVATTGVTDDSAVALVAERLGKPPAQVTLAPVKFPFSIRNITHNRSAELAMVERDTATRVLGLAPDTLSVTVDPDLWVPLDPVFVIETMEVFKTRRVGTVTAIVVEPDGTPVKETKRVVTFGPLILTCGGANPSCNPVRGAGFGQWIGESPGDELHVKFFSPFTNASRFEFVPRRSIQGRDILTQGRSIREQLEDIRVVPNPYVFFSAYEVASEQRRIMFTNLPPDGEIRIYTIAGQFVQEMDWSPDDLSGNGDLFWDLTTREGNEVLSGLYIFVVKAKDPATGEEVKKMGKFVVIR